MSHEAHLDLSAASQLGLDDQRHHSRRTSAASVTMTLESHQLTGHADNLSKGGLLFFSEGDLRVLVELVENGRREVHKGRLVRAQRLSEDEIGWAVEFDPS